MNKNEDESNDFQKLPSPPKPPFESDTFATDEAQDEMNLDSLSRALEGYGDNKKQFAALVRMAWSFFDPYMDEDGRLSKDDLIQLAQYNHGRNNAYTDLQDIYKAFQKALDRE